MDQNKIVVGKPAAATDADNGFIDPSVLATCLGQAKDQGWNAGAMVWEVRALYLPSNVVTEDFLVSGCCGGLDKDGAICGLATLNYSSFIPLL